MPFSNPYHALPAPIRLRTYTSAPAAPADLQVDPALHALGHRLSYRSAEAPEAVRDPEVPFQPAMERLHGTLTGAVEFFGGVLGEFKRETDLIDAYIRPDVLDEIWRCKIRGSDVVEVVPFADVVTVKKEKKKEKKKKGKKKKKGGMVGKWGKRQKIKVKKRKGMWSLSQRCIPQWYQKRQAKAHAEDSNPSQTSEEWVLPHRIVRTGYKDWVNRVQHDLALVETVHWPIPNQTALDSDGAPVPDSMVDGLSELRRVFCEVGPPLRQHCRDIDRVEACKKFLAGARRLLRVMNGDESWWRPWTDHRSVLRRWVSRCRRR